MSVKTEMLGGRLPLLDPQALSIAQKEIYDRLNTTMIPRADGAHFQSKTDGGKLIGPFNPILFSPDISARFLDLHDGEEKDTFTETTTSDTRTITIPFEAGAEKIEIVGTVIVPEFGQIAALVLAIAIISIIAVSAKTGLRFMPKY